jgi:hypothetical protein
MKSAYRDLHIRPYLFPLALHAQNGNVTLLKDKGEASWSQTLKTARLPSYVELCGFSRSFYIIIAVTEEVQHKETIYKPRISLLLILYTPVEALTFL